MKKPPFTQKGYYTPLVLSNGADFCQIDFSGSMAFKDHIRGSVSYWYKKGRPCGPDPLGIVKLSYIFNSDKGPVEIGDFSQRFDPAAAVLRTSVSMFQLSMNIVTFLTADHTLIEIFEITECGSPDAALELRSLFQTASYTNKPLGVFSVRAGDISIERPAGGAPYFKYSRRDSSGDIRGAGVSRVKIIRGGLNAEHVTEDDRLKINISGLSKNAAFARVSTVMDSLDDPDFEKSVFHVNSAYLESSPGKLVKDRAKTEADGAPAGEIRGAGLTELFKTSVYVCRASIHPGGSSVSALALPNGHGTGTYWDIWFVHRALLAANRMSAADKITGFWKRAYAGAKKLAAEKHGAEGARFAWVLRHDGTPLYDADQFHNNLIPVLTAWDRYLHTHDSAELRENIALMTDCVRFIVSAALKKDSGGNVFLRELMCPDESAKMKRNDLLTAAVTKRAVGILKAAAAVTGTEPDRETVEREGDFDRILESLKKDGVYQACEGGDSGNWAVPLAYLHLPDPGVFPMAAEKARGGCAEAHGLGISHASRMRCATFPWVEGIFSWSMAANGDPRAWEYLMKMTRLTNFYGGLPEYVWLHGEPSRDWFVAAHGVFIAALSEILFKSAGDTVEIFPLNNGQSPLKTLSVRNLRLPCAALISMDYKEGQGRNSVTLKNLSGQERRISVRHKLHSETLSLMPEETGTIKLV